MRTEKQNDDTPTVDNDDVPQPAPTNALHNKLILPNLKTIKSKEDKELLVQLEAFDKQEVSTSTLPDTFGIILQLREDQTLDAASQELNQFLNIAQKGFLLVITRQWAIVQPQLDVLGWQEVESLTVLDTNTGQYNEGTTNRMRNIPILQKKRKVKTNNT